MASSTIDRTVIAHATEQLLVERIAELWRWRSWYRAQANWSHWMNLARDNDVELRALLRIARRGRRLAAQAPDPLTEAKGWRERRDAGWTEAELAYARG